MAILTRVSRLFRADLHALLDRIEEPEQLLKQAIRDMEEDLAADRQRQRLLSSERSHLNSQLDEITQALERIEPELDICFTSGKDDLARSLIKRKLETKRKHKQLTQKSTSLEHVLTSLNQRIAGHQHILDNMNEKVELLKEDSSELTPAAEPGFSDFTIRDDEIEIAFLQEQQKRSLS